MKSAHRTWEAWKRSLSALVPGIALAAAIGTLQEEPDALSHRWVLVPAVTLYAVWVAWILRPAACARRPCAWSDWRTKPRFDPHAPVDAVLPICGHCKAVRPATTGKEEGCGAWLQVEDYVSRLTAMPLSHSICPACLKRYYAEDAGEDDGHA